MDNTTNEPDTIGDAPARRQIACQFRLSTLIVATAALAILFALMRYRGLLGAWIFFLGLAFVMMGVGLYRRQWQRTLGYAATVVVLFVFGLPSFPTHQSQSYSYTCTTCGLQRWGHHESLIGNSDYLSSEERFVETDFSKWHAEHFGDNCRHTWKEGPGGSSRYASIFGIRWNVFRSSWRVSQQTIELDDKQRQMLEALFAEDPKACQAHISNLLK